MKCCWVLTALKIVETSIYWMSGTIPGTICQSMSLLLIINLWGRNHYCLHFTDEKTEAQTPAVAAKLPAARTYTAPRRLAVTSPVCFLCRFFWIWGRILICYIPSIGDCIISYLENFFFFLIEAFSGKTPILRVLGAPNSLIRGEQRNLSHPPCGSHDALCA